MVNSSILSRTSLTPVEIASRSGLLISTLKCPEFASIHPSFMYLKSSPEMMSALPVTVMIKSDCFTASRIVITLYPSILASKARIGSTSVTMTSAPKPAARSASPLPHHPYPQTVTVFPAITILVVPMIASKLDCPVPYLLSKRYLVYASLTAITGNFNAPSACIACSLCTPVVVSSQAPLIWDSNSFLSLWRTIIMSAPSSMIMSGLWSKTMLMV